MDITRFGKKIDGSLITLYRLQSANGLEAYVSSYGCRLVALLVPDREGHKKDVILGYESLEEFQRDRATYFGAAVGRYANRIADASFDLAGKTHHLISNNGTNHLHGGATGFDAVYWKVVQRDQQSILMSYLSSDGEEGYPGNLEVFCRIELKENTLDIEFEAKTDQLTIVNLTNHAYFNLSGNPATSILNHELRINSEHITPVDERLIPDGTFMPVEGTAFDFRTPKTIGQDIKSNSEQMRLGGGYDHNFVLDRTIQNKSGLHLAAEVSEPESGIRMSLWTNQNGVQLYTGNFLPVALGKSGIAFTKNSALCLEPQAYPDSPNQPKFPSVELNPGETYKWHTIYCFDNF